MHQVTLEGTDLSVSNICLGGGPLGSTLDQEASFRFLDAFFEQGGNFIDTAKIYSDWLPGERSISEKTLGAWIASRKNRSKIIIGTKGAHPHLDSMQIQRLSPAEIVADLEASLSSLQTDVIDLYWLHRDDPQRPVGEIIETLDGQVRAGKVRCFGCSNWSAPRLAEANTYAAQHRLNGFAANQMWWSLAAIKWEAVLDQTLVGMDADTYRLHQQTRLAAVPYASQANGFFQKLAAGGEAHMSPYLQSIHLTPTNRRRLERIRTLQAEMGLSITQVTLGYLLSQPFLTVPIVGCHTHAQLADSLSAAEVRLSPEQVKSLAVD